MKEYTLKKYVKKILAIEINSDTFQYRGNSSYYDNRMEFWQNGCSTIGRVGDFLVIADNKIMIIPKEEFKRNYVLSECCNYR